MVFNWYLEICENLLLRERDSKEMLGTWARPGIWHIATGKDEIIKKYLKKRRKFFLNGRKIRQNT